MERRHCPQARCAMPPSDSAALHCVKTAETGDSPASASPVLATETLASSLASAAARSCAGPQCQSGLWSGRPTRPCSPPSSACPPRSQKSAAPATRTMRARLPASAQPGLTRAGPARLVPLRLADWRFGESQSHLWPSVFRAGPYGLPCCPSSHGPALHTPGQKCEERGPRAPIRPAPVHRAER